MSILNGFIPLPNWYITRGFTLKLTHRERVLYFTIGVEVFRFPESRETMSKEMTTRGLQAITGINHSHIAKILNKFQRMGLIAFQKSFTKGISSTVAILAPDFNKTGNEIATGDEKLGYETATNLINLSIKEDLKKDDIDSSLNIKQSIEEKPMENPLNCISNMCSVLISSKESNLNNHVINLLSPAGLVPSNAGNKEFSPLGSILSAVPIPDTNKTCSSLKDVDNIRSLSEKAISTGKILLLQKGFSSSEIQNITDRITASMIGKDIKSKDKYFIACCNKETRKGSSPASSVHKSTSAALPVQKKTSFIETVNKWEEENKKDSPVNILKKLMELSPDDLYRVILDVDTSPAGKFVSLPEIKASLYIGEFKKRYPDIIV
ncbi:MAG: hypothetical protein ABRQ39_32720 [Candidatus Eremiobacterota bacterium]